MCAPYICPRKNLWAFICLCLCPGVHACACVRLPLCVCACLCLRVYQAFVSVCVAVGLCPPAWLCLVCVCVWLNVSVSKGDRVSLICVCLSRTVSIPLGACVFVCPCGLIVSGGMLCLEAVGLDFGITKCEHALVSVSVWETLP